MRTVVVAIVLSALTTPAAGQWLNHPTPGIPRTADGKPNLTAPTPRTADGRPDFSGLWRRMSRTVAADLKPAQPWVEALVQQRRADLGKDGMDVLCLPFGPGYITTPGVDTNTGGMTRVVQTPALMLFLQADLTYRQIHMDGRTLETNPNPSWMGYSVGRWEGETLVVDSLGFNDRTWLDSDGHPHTEALRTIERYRRPDFGHLELDVTLQDSALYATPWTATIRMQLAADTELLEYVCNEGRSKSLEHWVGKASDDKLSEVKVAPEILATYTGTYVEQKPFWARRAEPRILEITVSEGALFGELSGYVRGGKLRLMAQSETSFAGLSGLGLEFVRGSQGLVTQLSLKHVSGDYTFVRTK